MVINKLIYNRSPSPTSARFMALPPSYAPRPCLPHALLAFLLLSPLLLRIPRISPLFPGLSQRVVTRSHRIRTLGLAAHLTPASGRTLLTMLEVPTHPRHLHLIYLRRWRRRHHRLEAPCSQVPLYLQLQVELELGPDIWVDQQTRDRRPHQPHRRWLTLAGAVV